MNRGILGAWVLALWVGIFPGAFGQLTRVANTTLKMPATPPPKTYMLQQAFGQTFGAPVAVVTPPGETNRVFIVEKDNARILVLTNLAQATPSPLVFLNIRPRVVVGGEQGLLGLAFHPNYAENGYFYVFYTTAGTRNDRLSRFTVSSTNINVASTNSEVILIDQRDEAGNHNGGDLHFGLDGYLYVSLGDEGDAGDSFQNSQRINKDFFAGILRIDVDKREGNLPANAHAAASANYLVPADNPFVGATSFNGITIANPATIRTEFWATGLRNPWRMAFDEVTGKLWCGDVGQGAREEIDIITKGGNYGWNYREGIQAYAGTPPPGFQRIDPVWDYPRSEGYSVTGGRVYRGSRLPELQGLYVFGDYGTGRIWALRTTNDTSRGSAQLLTSNNGISAFGVDPTNGDLLVCDVDEGLIRRLVYSTTPTGTPLPATLAATGAFSDLSNLAPNAGIVPYQLNLPFWSDGASKARWFSIPDVSKDITFAATEAWQFPTGAVFIKHFEIQTNDNPVATRRLETRFIVRNTNGVYGVTYRWTNATTAVLVDEAGMDESMVVTEGGVDRTQVWHYPSWAECLVCHNPAAGLVLGFNSAQLNRDATHGSETTNQIAALKKAGYFTAASEPADYHGLRALAGIGDADVSQEFRVRSYLEVNCALCHRPAGGSGLGQFDARIATATDEAGLVNGALSDSQGNPAHRALVPNEPDLSMILKRMNTRGVGKMPPIASNVIDTNGVDLLRAFITGELATRQSFAQWQAVKFPGDPLPAEAAAEVDADLDGASNMLEWLAKTEPKQGGDAWKMWARNTEQGVELFWNNPSNRGVLIEAADGLDGEWELVNHPDNRMLFPTVAGERVILDGTGSAQEKYYRARIEAP